MVELWRSRHLQPERPAQLLKQVRITSTGLRGSVPEQFDPDAWIERLGCEYRRLVLAWMPGAEIIIRLERNGTIGYQPDVDVDVWGADVETVMRVKHVVQQAAEIQFVAAYMLIAPSLVFQSYNKAME